MFPACRPRHGGGFNFANCLRNAELVKLGFEPPQAFNSGTTVVAIVFNDGIMIGADTRTTNDESVSSTQTKKIYQLHNNVFCGGAGSSSDLRYLVRYVASELDMHYEITNHRAVRVNCAKQLIKELVYYYYHYIHTCFLVGGVDHQGSHLFCVYFDGTTESCSFNSIGSGHLGAIGILETRWHPNLDEKAARELVVDAITAGIFNDLYSGAGVELCIMRKDFTVKLCSETIYDTWRDTRNVRRYIKPGTAPVISSRVHYVGMPGESGQFQMAPENLPSRPTLQRKRKAPQSEGDDIPHKKSK